MPSRLLLALGVAFVVWLSLALPALAFEGRVVDAESGAPLAGATVSIVGLPGTASTDADGRFTWQPDPTPPVEIVVVLEGGRVARPVVLGAIDHAAVTTITVSALVDESISVSGVAPSIDATPAAGTTLLSAAQIERRTPSNLMQALETVPGVSQVSEGQAAVPAVRGLARGRTLILIDGARVTAERRVGPSATFLDPAIALGVDVARGPGSVAYGSDAFGGVISVRTKRAEAGSPLRFKATATGGAGVPEWRGGFEISQGFAKGGVLLALHAREADDWRGGDGEDAFNSGWKSRGGLLRFDHRLGRGDFSITLQSDFGRDIERPRTNSRTVRFYYPYEDSHRLTLGYQVGDVGGWERVSASAFFGTYEQRTDQDRFATADEGRSLERADISAKDFHLRLTGERALGRARLEVGADVNGRFDLEADDVFQEFTLDGELASEIVSDSIEDARRVDAGLFAQMHALVAPAVLLSGGARVDRVTTRNEGGFFGDRSTTQEALSGFASATLGPWRGFSITGQIARGFRDPVLSDRYYRGPTGRGFVTGNPDLEPETSLQYDLALRYGTGPVRVAFYGYEYRIDDLVERFEDPLAEDFFFFRNRGEARLRGLELELQAALRPGLALEVTAQRARGESLDDDTPLDDVSPDTLAASIRQDLGARGFVQLRAAWHDRDDRPGPTEVATPSMTLVDLSAGWRLSPAWEVRALARNLLDEEYPASQDRRAVLAPGRSLSVTTVVEF